MIYLQKSDVYAFAITVYEIITKEILFEGKNDSNILYHVSEMNKRLSFDGNVDKNYINLIKECWSKNPEKRPTFLQILRKLRQPEFTENIDKNEFENYARNIPILMKYENQESLF